MQSEWYQNLKKSKLTPPNWIFAPVWLILYMLIGLSLWFYIKDEFHYSQFIGLIVFALQMGLNFSWSSVFFVNHDIKGSFSIILWMLFLIALNIVVFALHSKTAAILLIPYFLWVSFATYLNYYIVKENPYLR